MKVALVSIALTTQFKTAEARGGGSGISIANTTIIMGAAGAENQKQSQSKKRPSPRDLCMYQLGLEYKSGVSLSKQIPVRLHSLYNKCVDDIRAERAYKAKISISIMLGITVIGGIMMTPNPISRRLL